MNKENLKKFLDEKVDQYNQPFFIKDDPIGIPHLFSQQQDIESAGFFAALFAWGNRTTIIRKSKELMQLMQMRPYEFCLHHGPKDLKGLLSFKHRTFNPTDLLYFIEFFKHHYSKHRSLALEALGSARLDFPEATIIYNYLNSLEYYLGSVDEADQLQPRERMQLVNG